MKTTGTVTDRYDFAWSKYNSLIVGFANNYAVLATKHGVIKPYNIVIKGLSGSTTLIIVMFYISSKERASHPRG